MILEFSKHNYVDVDKIIALRWMEEQGAGIVVVDGEKIVVRNREHFDVIETGYLYKNKSFIYGDKMKKLRFTKRDVQEGE